MTVVSLTLLGTAACGDDAARPADSASSSTSEVDTGQTIPGLKVTGAVGSPPQVKVDSPLNVDKTETEVVTAGSGNPVVEGQTALLHITVVNGATGKKAASTYDQGTPASVDMSEGSIFPALLEALVGKPRGSRVAVAGTVKETYGQGGAQQLGLGPSDTVVFVVDVVSVPPADVLDHPQGETVTPPDDVPAVEEKNGNVTGLDFGNAPSEPANKLQVIPLVKGDGPPARDDSLVTFDYFGEVWGGKQPFDESYSKQPVTFALGVGQLIRAWDQGLVGLNKGSRVMIIAPPKYGYGPNGNPQAGIKGTDTLVFVVDILGVDG
jgi:peptidylprolyl isomerase